MNEVNLCHPLLVPQNKERTLYHGFIKVNNQTFELGIELKSRESFKDAVISCEWKMKHLLSGCNQLITKRLGECKSLKDVLIELQTIIVRELRGSHLKSEVRQTPSYYKDVITQLEDLGWHRLKYTDTDLQKIHITCEDENAREHIVKLHLNPQHPVIGPKVNTDLPDTFHVTWNEKSKLKDVCAAFTAKLTDYQELWDCLDELDKRTWVLEPETHSYSATYRRIALGNNSSIQITVDVKNPRILPECRFLGADHVVNPLRDNLNKNLDLWDCSLGLYQNIQTLLEVDLPSRQSVSKEEMNVECGICYTYRLEGVTPDSVCEDLRCGQPFHQTCLYEWLRAVPTSRQSFNIVFGECPYCNKPITVKKPL